MELMPVYGPQFKDQIVKKMMPPHNQSVAQISRDTGVAVPTLYSWKKLFRNQGFVVPAKSSRPDDWDSKAKLAAIIQTAAMNEAQRSEYCRQHGLYPEQLDAWKAAFESLETDSEPASKAMAEHPKAKMPAAFMASEWWEIVDANQLTTWESYRDVKRLGRKTRLSEKVRLDLWSVFDQVNRDLTSSKSTTYAGMFAALAARFKKTGRTPFDFVVVDESQDITPSQLAFVATIAGAKPDGLFFAGDLGQRIFQLPFSWKAWGVDIRGRSRTLTVNYRTTHQIRQQADRLLGPEVTDVDGISENRKGTVSIFNGPDTLIRCMASADQERDEVAKWIKAMVSQGVAPHEIGLIVRSETELPRAKTAAMSSGFPFRVLGAKSTSENGKLCLSTMHSVKGLEFRSVAVMACDDDIVPLQKRIDDITDEADLAEVYATERHLLYVAITRARDHLLITSGGMASEFLDDFALSR